MTELDVKIREFLLSSYLFLIGFPLLILIQIFGFQKVVRSVRLRIFAWFPKDYFCPNFMVDEYKEDLFSNLEKLESNLFDLKNRGLIRILEIGIGTGTINLKYYPQQARIIVVDPKQKNSEIYYESKERFSDLFFEKFIVSEAENMYEIKTESVDIVVCTHVACCFKNSIKALEEIRRVLAPGGKFYFLEHTLDDEDDGTKTYNLQKLLSKGGFWPFIFDGCHLNRRIDEDLARAGFDQIKLKHFYLESSKENQLCSIYQPHIMGIATKTRAEDEND